MKESSMTESHSNVTFLRRLILMLGALALNAGFTAISSGATFHITSNRASGVYREGQRVDWKIVWHGRGAPPQATFQVLHNDWTVVSRGKLLFHHDVSTVKAAFTDPGSLLLVVTGGGKRHAFRDLAGAVADPQKIRPAAACPANFWHFWKKQIARLNKIPVHVRLISQSSGVPGVKYWHIHMDNIHGLLIRGQMARPAKGRTFPAVLILQWAGVYPLDKSWVTDYAKHGWLALNISAHDLPIAKPASFYTKMRNGPLKDYPAIGNANPNTSYFLRMYLSCYRALQYLRHRKHWNGKTLLVMGTSQGGLQTLMLAGLHPSGISAAIVKAPAGCNMLAPLNGCKPSWPYWYNQIAGKNAQQVRQTSRYYDVANFTTRIRCPVLASVGLIDETCPPPDVLAALNEIKSHADIVVLPHAEHPGHQKNPQVWQPFTKFSQQWQRALLLDKPVPLRSGVHN
jgi:cephalosporin-C deacetylase-like acetyl esterase